MILDYNKKYTLDKNMEVLKREDNYLYIDYENVNWFRTNSTGHELISQLDGERTLNDVIQNMSEKKGFSQKLLTKELSPYIEKIIDKQIVVEKFQEKPEMMASAGTATPVDYWIHVAGRCNLDCNFCYSRSGVNNIHRLEVKDILSFFSKLPEEDRTNVVISGGEPFLYKDLPELVKKLKEYKFKNVTVISNGTVGEEMYEEVIPYIDYLQISVDGTTADIHDSSRGKGSFNKMTRKFKLAKSKGAKKIFISFTPTRFNILDLPNLPKFAYENEIDSIHITRLMPVGRGKENKNYIQADEKVYQESLNQFFQNLNKMNDTIFLEEQLNLKKFDESEKRKPIMVSFAGDQSQKVTYRHKRKNCGLGGGSISINYDGNIYPCASLQYDKFKLGFLKDADIFEVIKKGQEFSENHGVDNISGCKDCKMRYFCGGGCRACAMAADEEILGKDPMCDYYKEAILEIMWNFEVPSRA